MNRQSVAVCAAALMLAACAATGAPPPRITYDREELKPALPLPEPAKPVEIVTLPEPLPLPGQLQPVPKKSARARTLPPQARVDAANRAAAQEPTRDRYLNAVQVYPFTPGALYRALRSS